MRILFHIHALNIGGAERQLTYLVKGLVARRIEVHIVTFYKGGQFWDELEEWGKCTLHSLDRKCKWDFTVIPKIIRYIRSHNIDLIQGWMFPCNSFSALASVVTRKPVCMAIRASNAEYGLGGRLYFQLDKVLVHLIAKKVIYNSYAGLDYHLGKGYPQGKCIVIPNGLAIPNGKTFPAPFQHAPPWKIGMIARLNPMKDHVMMFEALRLLLQKSAPVELHLYGDGKDAWVHHLRNEVERLGIEPYVIWHGWAEDVWDVLAQIDIFSFSSSYGEGMSNSLLEAMLAERVIVATDVGDAKRILNGDAGRCGWIVPVKDPQAMADAIVSLIENPADAIKMGRDAKGIAIRQYSVEAMVARYSRIFTSCAE